ncbi:hypothetical protein ACFL27_06725 [candidate division CSSED10-310 bacterium]|uniref:Zinc ribbon domain-containing protein n=1 Tax=candidate division CSSED10-310 bacterium TaxID=2855610 RepID=A0ABV6YUP1_UNCC1
MDAVNQCPKCGFSSDSDFTNCPQCGIIISKFLAIEKRRQEYEEDYTEPEPQPAAKKPVALSTKIVVVAIVTVSIWWGWKYVFHGFEAMKSGAGNMALISSGEEVNLNEHLIPDSYTVFLFSADW